MWLIALAALFSIGSTIVASVITHKADQDKLKEQQERHESETKLLKEISDLREANEKANNKIISLNEGHQEQNKQRDLEYRLKLELQTANRVIGIRSKPHIVFGYADAIKTESNVAYGNLRLTNEGGADPVFQMSGFFLVTIFDGPEGSGRESERQIIQPTTIPPFTSSYLYYRIQLVKGKPATIVAQFTTAKAVYTETIDVRWDAKGYARSRYRVLEVSVIGKGDNKEESQLNSYGAEDPQFPDK